GEVIVHDDLLSYAGDVEVAEQHNEDSGFTCIAALREPAADQPLEPLAETITESARDILAAYLHPTLAQRLKEHQSTFINEHRKVTILFVGFEDFDYDSDHGVGTKLQDYLVEAIRSAESYGGYFSKADMGDKGSKYLVLFGTP